jgi:hypothetical protein
MAFLTSISMMGLCALVWALAPEHRTAPPPESVTFDGQTLIFAAQSENQGETVREYIPAGQRLESWTRLASIREYPNLNDPKAVVANLIQALKQQNPQARSAVAENRESGEIVVDFVTWPPDESFVEFNVFKYSRTEGGGLIAHQYALRDYEDPKGFLRGLKPVRARLVKLMAEEGLKATG